jgi:HAD superfamily hydrolase (TIGR01484 family)
MRDLAEFTPQAASRIRGVFCDIDDTLTTEGRLPADAYRAVERFHEAGLFVAPITGRPAGWCDMIARFWPVAGVVGENGAFYFAYDEATRKMVRVFAASDAERQANHGRLAALEKRILDDVPGSAVSADQRYREADLAIDFCEDVPALPMEAVQRIKRIFEEAGATAKISSIHVNGWFGQYDKLSMTRRFARERLGIDLDAAKDAYVFVGDSPNDAPMFGFFPHSCGVANVRDFEGRIEAEPAFVAGSRGGAGFVEIAEMLLANRQPKAAWPAGAASRR